MYKFQILAEINWTAFLASRFVKDLVRKRPLTLSSTQEGGDNYGHYMHYMHYMQTMAKKSMHSRILMRYYETRAGVQIVLDIFQSEL